MYCCVRYNKQNARKDSVLPVIFSYIKGQIEHGIIPTAKHYLADGGTTYGTGEGDNLIDRGDAQMSEDVLRATHLLPYKRAIAAGVDVVMPSFSSFQGTKMHENKYLLTDVLKEELGSEKYRELAKKLVEKSLVLVKNDQTLLPFKKGQKIFVTGPALDNIGVQCGGWTKTWQGVIDEDGEESKHCRSCFASCRRNSIRRIRRGHK